MFIVSALSYPLDSLFLERLFIKEILKTCENKGLQTIVRLLGGSSKKFSASPRLVVNR
jgi:hypothetical protein